MPDLIAPTPDATTLAKGKVQLAGDLTGTAALPRVTNGVAIQVVHANYITSTTGTTTIPYDDTIPQITEGDEYMSLTITPRSSTNNLIVECDWIGSNSASTTDMIAAIFRDSTANALAAGAQRSYVSTGRVAVHLKVSVSAGSVAATTFRVRAGASDAGTTTFNGASGARRFGGISSSSITVTEVRA